VNEKNKWDEWRQPELRFVRVITGYGTRIINVREIIEKNCKYDTSRIIKRNIRIDVEC
jgi:hypothetical protein